MTNYFKHKMRSKSPAQMVGWVILGIVGVAALITLFGFVAMWLWNALMPEIFGLATLTYWQAVGLLILSKLFFGGFGGGGSNKKHSKKKRYKCDDNSKNDFSKWELYDKYWEEEGDQAYREYIQRSNSSDEDDQQS